MATMPTAQKEGKTRPEARSLGKEAAMRLRGSGFQLIFLELPPDGLHCQYMRQTLATLPKGVYAHDRHTELSDRGVRRYHLFSYELDSTSLSLQEPQDHWDEQVKAVHRENRANEIKRLESEYGPRHIASIIQNSLDLGPKSMSMLAHHNSLHTQARRAFIVGAYYPALVAACALGERILNHLVIDLRDHAKSSEHYKNVYRKESFPDWPYAVSVLTDWGALADGVGTEFLTLGALRNRSVHFNPETYEALREDSLAALQRLDGIIGKQFGYFRIQPWFIEDTPGAQFVKRAYECNAFVRVYLIPRSAYVGPMYGMEIAQAGWQHLDYSDYGDEDITDEEFAKRYRERDPANVVTREMIERQRKR